MAELEKELKDKEMEMGAVRAELAESERGALEKLAAGTESLMVTAAEDALEAAAAIGALASGTGGGGGGQWRSGPYYMDDGSTVPSDSALVPVNVATIEFTSGLIGAAIGLAVGEPMAGAVAATVANYASRQDGSDAGEAVSAVSAAAIRGYNYLAQLTLKYEVLDQAKSSVGGALNTVKKRDGVDEALVEKLELGLVGTIKKMKELNDKYDAVNAGVMAMGVVGDLVEKTAINVDGFSREYRPGDRLAAAVREGIDKARMEERENKRRG